MELQDIKNSDFFRRICENKSSLVGAIIICCFILVAAFAPVISRPHSQNPYLLPQYGYSPEPQPPSKRHIFGTTQDQYDLFHAIVWGTRTAFKIGIVVVGISLALGVILGILSGYYGGWIDETIMRFTDIILSLPGLVLAVVIVCMLGPGIEKVIIAIAAVSWPGYARLMRGDVMVIKNNDFVSAAKIMGASDLWIFTKHILPNSIYPLVIVGSLDIGAIVLTAAFTRL